MKVLPAFLLLLSFPSWSFPLTASDNYRFSYLNEYYENNTITVNNFDTPPIEPTTIISVGMSIAKLFLGMFPGDQGPSMGEYFKNLSEQIDVVNQKMDALLTEIEKVQAQIVQLPPIIVTKLKQREIQGSIGQYEAILTGLQQSKYKGDIKKFMQDKENRDAVKNLVDIIRKTKSELEGVDDPFVVPFVAVAIHIEYNLRQNFLNQPLETYGGYINQDQKYLVRNTVGNKTPLTEIATAASLIKGEGNTKAAENSNTLKDNLTTLTERWNVLTTQTHQRILVQITERFIDRQIPVYYKRILEYYAKSQLYSEQLDSVSLNEIKVLKRIGIIESNVNMIQFRYPDPVGVLTPIGNDVYPPTDGFAFDDFNASFDSRKAQAIDKIRNMLATQNLELKQTFYALSATASAYYTGLNAIEFCNARLRLTSLIKMQD